MKQLRNHIHQGLTPVEPSAFLKSGLAGFIVSLLLFFTARPLGASPVAAHLAALLVAGPVLALIFCRSREGLEVRWKINLLFLFRYAVAFSVAASLQGAIFLHLQRLEKVPDIIAFGPAALGGVVALLLLLELYVFKKEETATSRAERLSLVFIIAMVVIRFCYLGLPELMEQEAYYWNYAQHPALGYLDHPPLVAALIWLGTKLFGISEFGVRIGAFVCWLVTALFSYLLARKIFDHQAAVGSLVLLALLPLYFGTGFLMTPDAPLHAAWASLLYFSYRSLIDHEPKAWFGIGISFGLSLLSKYTIVLLGPPLALFMLFDKRSRTWFSKPGPYLALLVAIILFSPVIVWNMQHGWTSFLFQSAKRISADPVFSTPNLIGHVTLMLTPVGLLGVVLFFVLGNEMFRSSVAEPEETTTHFLERTYFLLLLLSLLPFLLFLVISFTREVKLNWSSPVWLAVLPFLGCTVTSIYGRFCSISLMIVQELWRLVLPVLVLLLAVGLHYVTLGIPGLAHPPGPFLIGWDGLTAKIEMLADEIEKETGERPLVVGMDHYQIASGLAFYRTKNARRKGAVNDSTGIDQSVGWHLFGLNSRMYQMWFDTSTWEGSDVIAVAYKRSRLEPEFLGSEVIFASEIRPLVAQKQGQEVRRFYYRLISADTFRSPRAEPDS